MRAKRLGPELPARPAPVHTTPTPTSEEDIDVAALPGWSPSAVHKRSGLKPHAHTYTNTTRDEGYREANVHLGHDHKDNVGLYVNLPAGEAPTGRMAALSFL